MLGMEFLRSYVARFDYAAKTLTSFPRTIVPMSGPPARAAP
jgi:hypothetical protein